MVKVRRRMDPMAVWALTLGALLPLLNTGCSKTNDIDAGPASAAGSCAGNDCRGACVEGACRPYCDANYQCSGKDICTSVDDVPVCLPPDAKVYPDYAPFDMLEACATAECEVPLDEPPLSGVLRQCSGPFLLQDVGDADFDFAAACRDVDDYGYLAVQGRRLYSVWNGGSDCRWAHLGAAAKGTLVSYGCDYALDYESWEETFRMTADFLRVVERGDKTYVWMNGPYAFEATREWRPWLYEVSGEAWSPPGSCEFSGNGFGSSAADPDQCALPVYERLGPALGAEHAGLWVACDERTPTDCDTHWSDEALNGTRLAMYIDARGFGQYWHASGSAYDALPTRCDTAYRTTGGQAGWVVGRSEPIGWLGVERAIFGQVVEIPPGTLAGDTEVPPGKYLVVDDPNLLSSGFYFKQLPLPGDFVDPCEGSEPNLTW